MILPASIRTKGFALPTVLVLSLVLLIIGLSTLQVGSALSRSLSDQHWDRLAKEAAQAGVAYASSCLKTSGAAWGTNKLDPGTTCQGTVNGAAANYAFSSSGDQPRWTAYFEVSPVTNGTDGKSRATSTGRVQLISEAGYITKTYTNSINVYIANLAPKTAQKLIMYAGINCVIASDQQAYCAGGDNTYGRFANGTTAGNVLLPKKFNLPSGLGVLDLKASSPVFDRDYTYLSTETGHLCALATDKQLYCAGANKYGQLGNGTVSNTGTGNASKFLANGSGNYQVLDFTLGGAHTCIATPELEIVCSGDNRAGQIGQASSVTQANSPIAAGGGYKVVASARRTCVISHGLSDAYCTGVDTYGEHADGSPASTQYGYTTMTRNSAAFPPPASVIRDISLSGNTSCIITNVAACAGMNYEGQLGNNTTTNSSSLLQVQPTGLGAGQPANYLNLTLYTTCVVITGNGYCSGRNSSGQLGAGNTTSPQTTFKRFNVPSNIKVSKIRVESVNQLTACAMGVNTSNGNKKEVWCSGRNDYGQTGDGTTTTPRSTPVKFQLPSGLNAIDFDTEFYRTCVLASDQQVYCTGYNGYGSFGDGTSGTGSVTPVKFQLP